MERKSALKHNIDILFLMVLFLILTFSAVSVLLLAINSYRNVTQASESNASARTASAYIREMVHQNDTDGNISLGKLGGIDAIVIDEDDYLIYIYEFEGNLCELDTSPDSGADWRDGQIIMELVSVSFDSKENGNIIEVTIGDTYGNSEKVDVCLRSKGDEDE